MAMRPQVGVAVILVKKGEILIGKRINSLGNGYWAPPGGHLEFGESFEECASRELKEETGLAFKKIKQGPITNDIFYEEKKHYVTIFMIAEYIKGTPQLMEPHKCESWHWVPWNKLPTPLFLPFENLIKQGFTL